MANKHSRKIQRNKVKDKTVEKLLAEEKPAKIRHEKKGFRVRFLETKGKIKERRAGRIRLHKSFHRSYREDYQRDNLLHNFQLHKRERSSVTHETYAVGRYLTRVLGQSNAPRKEDNQIEGPR